jgi:hypothetical protein
MADIEVLITPLTSRKVACVDQLTNLLLDASQLYWCVHGVNVIQLCVYRNLGEIICEGSMIVRAEIRLERALESEFERKLWILLFLSILTVSSKFAETNLSNLVSGFGESS